MASARYTVMGDFYAIVTQVVEGVRSGSISASLEGSADFTEGNARCAVRVMERYSMMGENRVSLSLTFFQVGNGPVEISAITSGGSQAVFFKVNTWGEEAFLDKVREVLDRM